MRRRSLFVLFSVVVVVGLVLFALLPKRDSGDVGQDAVVVGAAAPAVVPPAPYLLDPGLTVALAHSRATLHAMKTFTVDQRLPTPPVHSAGGGVVEAGDAPVSAATDVDDAEKIALFFTGGEIGETDPCG
jgi:hypothetical protein